jgi:hypothetical protein
MKTKNPILADDDSDESSVQRVIPAGAAARPITTAATSVFDAGRQAKAASKLPLPDPAKVVIRKGVSKPPSMHGAGSGAVYVQILQRMQPTDSVELPLSQAKSLYARSKEFGKTTTPPQRYSFRKLNETTGALWRDA